MIISTWVKPAALAVGLLAAAYGGYHYRDVVAERDTAQFVIQAQETARAYTEQLQGIANIIEEQSYASEKKHDRELAYYRNLVERSGGLYDNGATGGATTPSTGNNQTTASGPRLSAEATGFLLDQANKADRVVDQYLQCQKYITLLSEKTK